MADIDPQKTFNVDEAETNLSDLMDRARAGEEIVLAKAGEPWAKIVPYAADAAPAVPLQPRQPGRFRHLLKDVPSDIWFKPEYTEAELDSFEQNDGGSTRR